MCDPIDENEDEALTEVDGPVPNVDPDGWEDWEPEFDEDGSAINLGANVRDPFKEHKARDE